MGQDCWNYRLHLSTGNGNWLTMARAFAIKTGAFAMLLVHVTRERIVQGRTRLEVSSTSVGMFDSPVRCYFPEPFKNFRFHRAYSALGPSTPASHCRQFSLSIAHFGMVIFTLRTMPPRNSQECPRSINLAASVAVIWITVSADRRSTGRVCSRKTSSARHFLRLQCFLPECMFLG